MFSKNKLAAIRSLVADGCRIQGDITFKDGIRIDGVLVGSLQGEMADTKNGSLVFVAEHGTVSGAIKADVIIVNGRVEGPIHASRMLELQPKARVSGDITYAQLEMHQGALVSGCMIPLLPGNEPVGKVLLETDVVTQESLQLAGHSASSPSTTVAVQGSSGQVERAKNA